MDLDTRRASPDVSRMLRSRTTYVLRAAFSGAIAIACRDRAEGVAPPAPPTVSAPPLRGAPSASTVASAPIAKRMGQRCDGSTLSAIKPAIPVDYLELRMDLYPQGVHEIVHAGTTGTACGSATHVPECIAALASASLKTGEYLVYTRGDEVQALPPKDVVAFLAPIDGPEEAALALVLPRTAEVSPSAPLPDCDPGKYRRVPKGYEVDFVIRMQCDERTESTWLVGIDGVATVTRESHVPPTPGCQAPFLGRRPEGLILSRDGSSPESVGEFFAQCTEMESASVHAFERLAAELRLLGAPKSLGRRAKSSATDERRHARAMRSLARRFGGRPERPRIMGVRRRAPLVIAIENAVHGCVFETWAALVASWQALHAKDELVRSVSKTIARDETRHAALARDVAAWLEPRLTDSERERVDAARAQALRDLATSLDGTIPAELEEICGLPSRARARKLLGSLRPALVKAW